MNGISSKHRCSLDFLRFFAALGIAFLHYDGWYPLNNRIVSEFLSSHAGLLVEVFFFISGYLMAVQEERIANTPFLRFVLSRAARILPVHWIALLIHLVVNNALGFPVGISRLVSNALLMPYLLIDQPNLINPPSWFLFVLLLCWWIFWFILFCTKRRGLNPVPLYAVVLVIGLMARQRTDFFVGLDDSVARGFVGFFGGCLLAHLNRFLRGRKAVVTGLCIITGTIALRLITSRFWENRYLLSVFLLIPSLLLVLVNWEWLEKILPRRFCMLLGAVAFPVYLLDSPFLTYLNGFMVKYVPSERHGSIVMMLLTTAVLVLIAMLIHLFLEKPLLGLFSKAANALTADETKEAIPHDS